MVVLHANERIDFLYREDLKIIQSKDYFTYSLDALLLADFVTISKKKVRCLDFCTGTGVIPLLLSCKTEQMIEGIELQPELVDMAKRSVTLNGLDERIIIRQGDINDLSYTENLYDVITCNPPYFNPERTNEKHRLSSHMLARHEIALTMEQWVSKAALLLTDRGRLFVVHRPERLDDLMIVFQKYQLSISRLKFVYPKPDKPANIVLIEAVYRGGRNSVKVEPGLVTHTLDNQYTPPIKQIYGL